MRVALRRTANEIPFIAPFRYVCSQRHDIEAEHPVDECPVYVRGEPCTGGLKQIGGKRT